MTFKMVWYRFRVLLRAAAQQRLKKFVQIHSKLKLLNYG